VSVARIRRRRIAIGAASGLAIVAFAFGASLGDGSGPEPTVTAASRLSLAELAGQRVIAGFGGTEVPPALARTIRSGEIAGVILFAENLPTRAVGRHLVRRLQAIPGPPGLRDPLLVMVDQEGGLVKRIGGPPSASAEEMGARGIAFSRRQGNATAASLRGVGINVDLAPVLDVARPGGTIAATHRGFGSTPARVAATGVAFAEGLQGGGAVAAAKHFPGLGAARQNTDFAVERIGLSKATLRRVDEAPFRRFAEAGGEMVMLGTAAYPAFSPKPAAFARQIATGELRSRLGFQGVSITDAMEAAAVRDFGGPAKAGTAAARAGTDLLLFADFHAAARARRALQQGLRSAALSHDAFEASVGRVLRLRHGVPGR
jgi:beta-N-acetylhexosaminidase